MDSFVQKAKEVLLNEGFISSDEIIYIKTSEFEENPQILIINGQRSVRPGNKHIMEYYVKFLGRGMVDDEEFELIEFEIISDKNTLGSTNMSFYRDDLNLFNVYYKQLFRI